MSKGWFAMKRGISSHPMLKGKPERVAIWVWLLDNACWQDTPHDINGKTVTIPRGAVCVSERRIADEVGVGYQVVRTFLARLKAEQMINASVTHGRNVITLCNFEKYQTPKSKGNAAPNAPLTHDQRTKEQVNNSDYVGQENPVAKSGQKTDAKKDFTAVVFDTGVEMLMAQGHSNSKARSLVGKWRSQSDDTTVFNALQAAERERAMDVVAFVSKCVNNRNREWRVGDIKKRSDGRMQEYLGNEAGWVVLNEHVQ